MRKIKISTVKVTFDNVTNHIPAWRLRQLDQRIRRKRKQISHEGFSERS